MTQLQILADENMRGVEEAFSEFGQLRLMPGRDIGPEDLVNTDILLVRSVTEVNKALLENSAPRFVGTATAGYEHIDRAYLAARHIPFATAAGANANSVVEYVLSAIAVCGDHLERLIRGGLVGIVGAGHVGGLLAKRLEALGIGFRQYDPWLDAGSLLHPASLEEVLACQVIALHPELCYQDPWPSHHLLSSAELEGLAQDQLVINASRGAVVDNNALLDRLAGRAAPSFVLDVWEGEPAIMPELFEACDYGTAHIAGYSLDGKYLATRLLREAMCSALDLSASPVNFTLQAPQYELAGRGDRDALLRQLLLLAYDIREDDRLLAEALREGEGPAGFDRLRREYRERRELAGATLRAESGALLSSCCLALDLHLEAPR